MDNPLTQEHCDCLTKAIQSAVNTADFLAKCKRCGLPVDDLIAENEAQKRKCEAIKAEFYTTSP